MTNTTSGDFARATSDSLHGQRGHKNQQKGLQAGQPQSIKPQKAGAKHGLEKT